MESALRAWWLLGVLRTLGVLCAGALLWLIPQGVEAAVVVGDSANFVTTWNTENAGVTSNQQVRIPGFGAGYRYELFWEKIDEPTVFGTTSVITASTYTLTLPEPGIYRLHASGTIPRIVFGGGGDRLKLLTIEQWGTNRWVSMNSAFMGAANLRIPATDAPDLTLVTDMSSMFRGATAFNDPINHWDVSGVRTMQQLFHLATSFNQPLDQWDTGEVRNMHQIFYTYYYNGPGDSGFAGSAFNQDISGWDVSKVTDLAFAFAGATSFNQPLNTWNTASVTSLFGTFQYTPSFNQPLNNWDVSNVTNASIAFTHSAFNQPLDQWDTGSMTNMSRMFSAGDDPGVNTASVHPFNQDLSAWDVSQVTTMDRMFENAALSQENQDALLESWALQAVRTNVPFHLGLKSYTAAGAAAIETLQTAYAWTIAEQYAFTYEPGLNATLLGTGRQAFLTLGTSTTPVTVVPDSGCAFVAWSDGGVANPRTDVVTDSRTVRAVVSCDGHTGTATSAEGQANAQQRQARLLGSLPSAASSTFQATFEEIKRLTSQPIPTDPELARELLALLEALVELLQELVEARLREEG